MHKMPLAPQPACLRVRCSGTSQSTPESPAAVLRRRPWRDLLPCLQQSPATTRHGHLHPRGFLTRPAPIRHQAADAIQTSPDNPETPLRGENTAWRTGEGLPALARPCSTRDKKDASTNHAGRFENQVPGETPECTSCVLLPV